MTVRPADQIRTDLKRLADFYDSRPEHLPAPRIQVTRKQMTEIRRNPQLCGCKYAGQAYYFNNYELEPI